MLVPRESVKLGGKELSVAKSVSNEVGVKVGAKHQHPHPSTTPRSQTALRDGLQNLKNATRLEVVCPSSGESFSFCLFALVGLVRPSRPLLVTIMDCITRISECTVLGGGLLAISSVLITGGSALPARVGITSTLNARGHA